MTSMNRKVARETLRAEPKRSSRRSPLLIDSSFEGASAKAQASRAEGLHPGSASDMFPMHSPPKQLPLKPACFLRRVLSFLGFTRSARNSLGSVFRSSLQPSACAALPEPTSGEIWTVPLPYRRRRTAKLSSCSPSPRQRRRALFHRVLDQLVQVQVATLNWLALGCTSVPPQRACLGGALMSESQHVAVDNLERLCSHFLSAGDFDSSSLGRSEEKFGALLQLVSELPCSDPLGPVDVDRLLGRLTLQCICMTFGTHMLNLLRMCLSPEALRPGSARRPRVANQAGVVSFRV